MKSGLDIIFNNQELLVINKPAGIHSAALPEKDSGSSIAAELLLNFPEQENVSEKKEDGGLINRLDFYTSGCLIAAREKACWKRLRELSDNNYIYKKYLAFVSGKVVDKQGITGYIGSPYRRSRKVKVYKKEPSRKERALPAESFIEGGFYLKNHDVSLVWIVIIRGRRHQIRAHLASIGHPLVGDVLYGSERQVSDFSKSREIPEFFLHAEGLDIKKEISLQVRAPLPGYLQNLLLDNNVSEGFYNPLNGDG